MGKILVIGTDDSVPDGFDSHVAKNIFELKTLSGNESSQDYFDSLLEIGGKTSIGKAMLAAIYDSDLDIPIAPIVSDTYDTGFVPDVPGVVYNFLTFGYFPDAQPEQVRGTVMLFHELGHAVQWIQKRTWFKLHMKNRSKGGFNDTIERDNLVTHEWPLCKELGHPTRMHYLDMFDKAEDAMKRFHVTTKAARTIQRAARAHLLVNSKKE